MSFNEPKRKHYGLVLGVAIAVGFGLFRGTKMQATTQTDFIALLIAFLIILGVCAGIGYFIDVKLYARNKKYYYNHFEEKLEEDTQ